MADIFNFGGFIKNTNKRREKEAEGPPTPPAAATESQPSMTQSEFSYGSEGMQRRKPKATPPARMKP
jgi:hypothetical protein